MLELIFRILIHCISVFGKRGLQKERRCACVRFLSLPSKAPQQSDLSFSLPSLSQHYASHKISQFPRICLPFLSKSPLFGKVHPPFSTLLTFQSLTTLDSHFLSDTSQNRTDTFLLHSLLHLKAANFQLKC